MPTPKLQNHVLSTVHASSLQIQSGSEAGACEATGENCDVSVVQKNCELPCVAGSIPSVEECRLTEFADAICKANLPTMNDFLGKLVTLATAMIGGGIALLIAKDRSLPGQFVYWFFLALFACLLASLYGLMPNSHVYDNTVVDLRRLEHDVLAKKQRSVYAGCGLFVVAIMIGIVGFISR